MMIKNIDRNNVGFRELSLNLLTNIKYKKRR